MTPQKNNKWADRFTLEGVSTGFSFVYGLQLTLVTFFLNSGFYHDDAYISLRYARNLIEGYGLVWNPAEYVQGYTNFFFLMIVALLGFLGVDLYWASRILGVVAFLLLVTLLAWYLHSPGAGGGKPSLTHLPLLLTLTSNPLLVWSVSGLESVFFGLLVLAGCLAFLATLDGADKDWVPMASGVCFGLAFLTRPDGLVFPAVAFLWLLLLRVIPTQPTTNRTILLFSVSLLVIIIPYSLWQFFYYGDVVPNTFYAKATGILWNRYGMGFRYILRYFLTPPFLPLLVLLFLGQVTWARAWNRKLGFLATSAFGYASFILYAGGDHMPAFRLCVPLVAPLSILLWLSLPACPLTERRWFRVWLTLGVLVASTLQVINTPLNPMSENPAGYVGASVGNYIARAWPPGSLVALHTAGSTPYFAPRHRFIDMLGLADAHIAKRQIEKIETGWQIVPGHSKGDGDYVLARNPDFIIAGGAEGTLVSNPVFLSDLELARNPLFAQRYTPVKIQLDSLGNPVQQGGFLFIYYQKIQPPKAAPPAPINGAVP